MGEVVKARSIGQFVGVGSPDFDRLAICEVTLDQLAELRRLGCSPAGFLMAHQIIKSRAPDAIELVDRTER